jgi:hypothetical protein
VDFYPWLLFDSFPSKFEFFLHLTPDLDRVNLKLGELLLSLIFELPESVSPLDNSCLLHQEFELLEVGISFVEPPSFLDHDCCHPRASRSLEHLLGILDNSNDLSLINDTVEHILLTISI